ncbi:hypothetical protein SCA6_010810 [Theobroma cacao]
MYNNNNNNNNRILQLNVEIVILTKFKNSQNHLSFSISRRPLQPTTIETPAICFSPSYFSKIYRI